MKTIALLSLLLVPAQWAFPEAEAPTGVTGPDQVTLLLEAKGGAPCREALVRAQPVHGGQEVSTRVGLEQGVTTLTLPLDLQGPWTITAEAAGCWSPSVLLDPGAPGESLRLTLWPATFIHTEIQAPGDVEVEEVHLRLERSSSAREVDASQPSGAPAIVCPVPDPKDFACLIPRGQWDFQVQAKGLAPSFVWNVSADTSEPAELDPWILRRGGSVFGRVVTEDGPSDPRTATIELRPFGSETEGTEKNVTGLTPPVRSTGANGDGGFQFVGVPPGTFVVEAAQPGFAPARLAPVEVVDGEWTEIKDPLWLKRPLRLTVNLTPQTGPYGKAWSVLLYRSQSPTSMAQVARGTVDPTGGWESPPLPEGRYTLQILDDLGNSAVWREVDLTAESGVLDVEVPLVFVEGRVVLGDEPLEARLWFGGETGAERVETESDQAGEFSVILPRDGDWTVDVVAETPPVNSRGLEVAIEPLGGLRLAEVTVEVPDTSVEGAVVDAAGLPPIGTARIQLAPLYGDRRPVAATTDPSGHFEVRGINTGSYSVEAELGDTSSDAVVLEVAEDHDLNLQLQLRPKRIVAGRVVASTGPIGGATVVGYALSGVSQPASAWLPTTRTGLDGRFRFRTPAGTTRMRLVTMAPGYALDVREVSEGASLEISLSHGGGLLRLSSLRPADSETNKLPVLLVGGYPLDLPRLSEWARTNGEAPKADGSLVIPEMPPGPYSLCRLEQHEALLVLLGAAIPKRESCVEGFLAPGGELELGSGS